MNPIARNSLSKFTQRHHSQLTAKKHCAETSGTALTLHPQNESMSILKKRQKNYMTNLTLDEINYSKLLAEIAPRAITTQEEYDRLLVVAERLTFAKSLTSEEKVLYKLLVTLIEVYETENYPIESEPHEILQHIMESSGTHQADLVGIIGSSGVVSEVVNGKRGISKAQAKALGDYFKISASLFI
jgi:HTH-type transcriptional regulator/antitoxin HigA